MICETCSSRMSCIDTRQHEKQNSVRRRYICSCGQRLTTLEIPAAINPDNRRELIPRDLSRFLPALARQWKQASDLASHLSDFLKRIK